MSKVQPLGFYVLIEMDDVENQITEGDLKGFILDTPANQKREQTACDTGVVLAFGPTCFVGFVGCEKGPEAWGVKVGDRVEYESYEGKGSKYNLDGSIAEQGRERLRFIPDSKIIGKVS